MHTRILRAAAAAAMLLCLAATSVGAGGWATIVADDAAPPEPRAGEEVEYGFTVLQHGQTPAGWEEPTLRLTNTFTGESFDVPAEPSGGDGHFIARFAFPSGGSWTWSVQLRDLLVETQPVTGMVLEADGSRPTVEVDAALGAIERANADAVQSLRSELLPKIDRLERNVGGIREEAAGLRAQLRELSAERDALASQASAASSEPSSDAIPPLGVALLAILGGALAGFFMVWLGQRREPVALDGEAAAGQPASGRRVTT